IILFISIIILGYFLGKVISILLKIILNKILGLDSWLHKKGIFKEQSFSNLIINVIKFFIYFYFVGYAFFVIPNEYLISIGNMITSSLNYLIIIILSMIVAYGMIEYVSISILEPFLNGIKYKNLFIASFKFISMYFIFILVLSYINLLSPVLLYLFIILFGGIVLTFSISFGIAFGYYLKRKFKDLK
ncbi:MAG: hypothetical protein ACP5G1_03705, partial [Nanopusillaceae archaeon]